MSWKMIKTTTVLENGFKTVIPPAFEGLNRRCLFSGEPKINQLGDSGIQSSFLNAQGLRIASYFWPVWQATSSKFLQCAGRPLCCCVLHPRKPMPHDALRRRSVVLQRRWSCSCTAMAHT